MSLGGGEPCTFGFSDDVKSVFVVWKRGRIRRFKQTSRRLNFCAPPQEFMAKIKKPNCDNLTLAMIKYERWIQTYEQKLRQKGAKNVYIVALREPYFLPEKKASGPPAYLFADICFFGYVDAV